MSYSEDNITAIFKIVIVGNSGVGKTNLLSKFIDNDFNYEISPTIGVDFSNFQYEKYDKKYKLQIWDTAGQERFKEFAKSYFKGTHGIMLVYDITNKDSYNNLEKWINKIKDNLSIDDVKIILIGNKIDLEDQRKIQTEEGLEFSKTNKLLFAETSAYTNEKQCINTAFEKLVEELISNYKEADKEESVNNRPIGIKINNDNKKNCC